MKHSDNQYYKSICTDFSNLEAIKKKSFALEKRERKRKSKRKRKKGPTENCIHLKMRERTKKRHNVFGV